MDIDNGGDIEMAELKKAYEYLNAQEGFTPISEEKIDEILQKVDQDNNGLIEYSEFLAHALTSKHLNRSTLESFFKIMLPATND